MESRILYTTHCPMCKVLEAKLKQAGISYQEETSIAIMENLGIMSVPILSVNGKFLNFKDAVSFVNNIIEQRKGDLTERSN